MMAFAEDLAAQQAVVADFTEQAQSYLDSLLEATEVSFSNGFNIDSILPDAYNYATVPPVSYTHLTLPTSDLV